MANVSKQASDPGWQPLGTSAAAARDAARAGGSAGGGAGAGGAAADSGAGDAAGATKEVDPVSTAFTRLALTHGLVNAGDAMVTVALAGSLFFSINPHAASTKVALSLVFTMLPFGIVAPFLGPAIDRSKAGRKIMLVGSAAGRFVACFIMARYINSLLLFPAALLLLILSKGHAVAKAALVPGAVRSHADLVEANSKLAMLSALVSLAAGAPAAGILKLFGGAWVLRVAAFVYLAGAVCALRCRPVTSDQPAPPRPDHQEAFLGRGVKSAATSMAVLRGVVGFLTFFVAFDFRRHHAPSLWFGIVLGASLIGGFAGAAVGPRLRALVREEWLLAGTVWLVAGVALLAGLADSRALLALLALTVGASAGAARLAFDAIVQRDGSEAGRGRAFARFETIFQVCWVGAALVPVLIPIPTAVGCFLLAVVTGVAGVVYARDRWAARDGGDLQPAEHNSAGDQQAAAQQVEGTDQADQAEEVKGPGAELSQPRLDPFI
jgi:hypothetical protein